MLDCEQIPTNVPTNDNTGTNSGSNNGIASEIMIVIVILICVTCIIVVLILACTTLVHKRTKREHEAEYALKAMQMEQADNNNSNNNGDNNNHNKKNSKLIDMAKLASKVNLSALATPQHGEKRDGSYETYDSGHGDELYGAGHEEGAGFATGETPHQTDGILNANDDDNDDNDVQYVTSGNGDDGVLGRTNTADNEN